MPGATRENNHSIQQGSHGVFRGAATPSQSFPRVEDPQGSSMPGCLPLGHGAGHEVQQKGGSDTLHGSASAILYASIILCLHLFALQALLKDNRKDPHSRALQKALMSCKYVPATRSAVTTAVAISLQALQLPPRVPAGHTGSAPAAATHGK